MNDKKQWLACCIEVLPESLEMLSFHLFELGAQGIEEREGQLVAYFLDRDTNALHADIMKLLDELHSAKALILNKKIEISFVPEEDWHAGWRKYFKPIFIGTTLCVLPPWEKKDQKIEHHLIIEPKQAFGTGNHATTKLMLAAIVSLRQSLPAQVLDMGTGSGILAIAHALLKPDSQILGVDFDPIAIENAHENAALNKVINAVDFLVGTFADVPPNQYPLIYANLQRHIIIPILPDFKNFLAPGGTILFSGILATEAESMHTALEKQEFRVIRQNQMEEWILLEVQHSD
ncbi:MAG: 50S ribosomal protein L11 methyltransferase [Calditrichaeota bacterium]|nr:MAG: 50S ribosomal protein L11 methyltransferase [Calditrichota bacterium]